MNRKAIIKLLKNYIRDLENSIGKLNPFKEKEVFEELSIKKIACSDIIERIGKSKEPALFVVYDYHDFVQKMSCSDIPSSYYFTIMEMVAMDIIDISEGRVT